MDDNILQKEVVLVTGASSGLGRAIAIRASERKATVILLARNTERLQQVADEVSARGGLPHFYSFDLENTYGISELFTKIVSQVGASPTVLINNAGYNAAGFIQNTPIEVFEKNYRVNTLAAIALIQCVLPDMVRRKSGAIANIMSTAMYHSFPAISSYYASKFALRAIHESLRAEVADYCIKTLYVEPCGFLSNYWKNVDVGTRLKNFKHPEHKTGHDPMDIADKIYTCLGKGQDRLIMGGIKDKIGYHLNYWLPQLVDKLIIGRNQKLLANRPDV